MITAFNKFAERVSELTGTAWGFILALALIISWMVSGPFFSFSEVWQLVINTTTTIITFLMVFLIQNTQNRDKDALHAKIDELIRSIEKADNSLIGSENVNGA